LKPRRQHGLRSEPLPAAPRPMREGKIKRSLQDRQESPMLRKTTFLAVAASAALGLVALNPVSASAHGGFHGGFHGGGHWGGHGHWGGYYAHHYHPYWRRPIWYAPRPVVYTAVRPAVVSSPGPCTCLSKEYTAEGAVVFKDRCTNEMPMNPP